MGDQVEHQINAQLIERLKPFYDFEHPSPLERVLDLVKTPFTTHYQPVIDTSSYQPKAVSDYSESQHVDRTVFALKKIMAFNHHFFTAEEARTLSPYPSGFINRAMLWSCCAVDAAIAATMFRNRHVSPVSVVVLGGLVGAQYFAVRTPNFVNNMIQGPSRRALARKYLSAYGPEFFHEIIDPRYDAEQLRHLHNKLGDHPHH